MTHDLPLIYEAVLRVSDWMREDDLRVNMTAQRYTWGSKDICHDGEDLEKSCASHTGQKTSYIGNIGHLDCNNQTRLDGASSKSFHVECFLSDLR